MKRFFLLGSACLMLASLSSCGKDYACTCTFEGLYNTSGDEYHLYANAKKSDAIEACEATEAGLIELYGGTATCTLDKE